MRSVQREQLYLSERNIITALINGCINKELMDSHMQKLRMTNKDFENKLLDSLNEIIHITNDIHLSDKILNNFQTLDYDSVSNEISDVEFNSSREFVSNLLKCDLSQVKWKHLENSVSHNSEGSCWPCDDRDHHIFTYPSEYGILSTDLLIHELGHSADFTISREVNDDDLLIGHQSIREGIAFYCQYKYLLTNGSRVMRAVSLASFLLTYLSILLVRYCLKEKITFENLNTKKALSDPLFRDLINSYDNGPSDGKQFILSRINDLKQLYPTLTNLIHGEISPRLGVLIGLILLNESHDVIGAMIRENSINNSLIEIIEKNIPKFRDSMVNISSVINDYIG